MIYVDTSVLLAHLLAEDRRPPAGLWGEVLIASRLAEYELWTVLHGRGLGKSHGAVAREVLSRVSLVELMPVVLARVLEPFTRPVRTLDAMHLATIAYLRHARQEVALATYDERMSSAARALGIPLYKLGKA